ncbi:MAG: magnesium protoporphyrin IX methyltransferase [Sandaracinobacteroides sp.]
MESVTASTRYDQARDRLEAYFDRTAVEQWKTLTSDAPVSRIRETVRAGRDRMRGLLLSWLPADMTGLRLLDAGCGTGSLAVEAAMRGAQVVAIDVSAKLIDVARERAPAELQIDWRVGDMLSPALGRFDHVVAMDSLIHYEAEDMIAAVCALRDRTSGSVLFTFAPSSPPLELFKLVGKAFPRSDRSPAIAPVTEARLRKSLVGARTERVSAGFYTSQALEVLAA